MLKNGSQHLHENVELKIEDVNDLTPVKTKRKISTKSLEFFDEKTKKKKKVLIYSPYKELKFFGLKFQKENGIIDKYHISLIEDEKNNLFLEKKLFYNKSKIIEVIKKKYLYKNLIFMEDKGKLIVQPIDFTEFLTAYIEELKGKKIDYLYLWKNHSKFRLDFYRILFGGDALIPGKKTPRIFQKGNNVNESHPIAFDFGGNFKIKGGVNFYITQELYERKQSIFKKIPEIPEKIVTSAELQDLRNQLNDNSFTISKLFGFRNVKSYSFFSALRMSDFAVPDFNVKVEMKKKSKDGKEKIFEGSFFMLDNDYNQSKKTDIISTNRRSATIKNTFSEEEAKYLDKDYIKMKKLTNEINFKSLNVVYENFFLYDLDNFIRSSYTTELQTEFSIYGLVNFSNETKKENKLHIISPKNYLKFNTIKDTHKNKLNLELTKVHTKKTFEIIDNNAYNFGILCTENERVGEKRTMKQKIIDVIRVIGIQKTEYSYPNPVHVHIKSESVIRKLMSKKTNKYRFVLTSMIFSSNIINDTDTIFLISDRLNDAKKIFINDSLEYSVGVCYLSEVNNWELIKGQSKRVQAVFGDSQKFAGQSSHFALTFTTINLSDILKFSITLVDGQNKLIKFKEGEENIPIINFDIEILE